MKTILTVIRLLLCTAAMILLAVGIFSDYDTKFTSAVTIILGTVIVLAGIEVKNNKGLMIIYYIMGGLTVLFGVIPLVI